MDKICLIGFMGCGKTTIGSELSKRLKCSFVDLDQYIEKKDNRKISEIFSSEGEKYFRTLESKCLYEVIKGDYCVISTGGGIITSDENIELLKEAVTIYLELDFDTLYSRIKGDGTRPLVTTYDKLYNRFEERRPDYEKSASISINCENKSIKNIVEEIIFRLYK